jgi:hypothetical protein
MNLLVLNNFIIEAFENKCQIDIIFTDFIKAFDRVYHNILLQVLRKSGFGDPLLSWFRSYLLGRFQWIKINGCKSNVSHIPSGIFQGGQLSPLLFALFINGIKEIIPFYNILTFTDDLKIYRRITNVSDCRLLQYELNSLVKWFESIGLNFNVGK